MSTRGASAKRMTQSEVVNRIAEKSGLDRAEVKRFFAELADLAAREVQIGGEFVLPGFGKLVRSERKAREGRNPATGMPIRIAAKTTVKFRLNRALKGAGLAGDPVTDPDMLPGELEDLAGDVIVDPD